MGTILGATKMVDMKFTKRFGRPRLRVVVLSPELIPDLVDIVIGEFMYEFQFRLETEEEENDPRLIDLDNQPGESGKKDDGLDKLNKDSGPNTKELDSNKENTKKDKKDGVLLLHLQQKIQTKGHWLLFYHGPFWSRSRPGYLTRPRLG